MPAPTLSKNTWRVIAAACAALGFALLAIGIDITASNPDDTTTTTGSTATTATTTPSSSSSSTSSSTTTTTSPQPAGWPGANNTGPTGTLTAYTSAQVEEELAADGLVENARITGGNIDPASGSTLRNFTLDGQGSQYGIRTIDGQTGVTVEDGEIFNVSSTGGYGGGVTYDQMEVHDSGADAFKPRSGTTVKNSWTHHLGKDAGCSGTDCPHGDAWQFDGPVGSTITGVHIVGNHCDAPWSFLSSQGTYHQQSCVQVNSGVNVTGSDVTDNFMHGAGSYSVNCSAPGSGTLLFSGNTFSTDVHYGPNTGCTRWEDNHYEDGSPA